jgi:UDP-2-acetamido-3-amino-2,3-dideoxy-glucuronate N-acetyltransferase
MASAPSPQAIIASSAVVDPTAVIGEGTKVWAFAQVAEHARIGRDCVIANGAYIDRYVRIGDRVRIHNRALLYHGLLVADDVFIGPGVCFTNDRRPKSGATRDLTGIHWKVGKWASIGANATILPDVSIGAYAVIGAGSVVTKNVPSHVMVYGNPAKPRAILCECGYTHKIKSSEEIGPVKCLKCSKTITPGKES